MDSDYSPLGIKVINDDLNNKKDFTHVQGLKDSQGSVDSYPIKIDPVVKRYKWIKLFWIFLTQVAFAVTSAIESPTTPDIRERIGLTMEQYSLSKITDSLGTVVGALVSGVLLDRWSRFVDMTCSISLLVMGLACIVRPWASSLAILCLYGALKGLSHGVMKTAQMALFFNLFGGEMLPNYLYHMGWSVASPIVPLVVEPFLSDNLPHSINGSFLVIDGINRTNVTYMRESRIEIPYAINGVLVLLLVPAFCFYQFSKPPASFKPHHKEKSSLKEVCSFQSCSGEGSCFNIAIIVHLVLFYILLDSSVEAKWTLEFSYVIDPRAPLKMTKTSASHLTTASSIAYLVSRVLTVVISFCLPSLRIQTLLTISVTALSTLIGLYAFIGLGNTTWIWIFSIMSDLFQQPTWPGGLIWGECYIQIYSVIVASTEVGKGLSRMFISWLNGWLFDLDPSLPFVVCFGISCIFFVNFIIMQVIASFCKVGTRDSVKETTSEVNHEDNSDTQFLLSEVEE